MSRKLRSIMEAADRLTVSSIAQEPYCVTEQNFPGAFAEAVRERYDWLPVRESDGVIRRIVETRHLEHLTSWRQVENQARKVGVDDLVAVEAPVFSILDRIQERPFLLCLG